MTTTMYGFWRSIASFRVRVALRLKGLEFDEIPIDILSGEQFEPGYSDVNAERVVPTLVHEGYAVFQSLAIIEYLDDVQPSPRLIPRDAKEAAYARALALVSAADTHPLLVPRVRNHLARTFNADVRAIAAWGKHWTSEGLATYERLLARRVPAPFVMGSQLSISDICIAGHVVGAHLNELELTGFPLVAELAAHCFAMPAFATSHPFEQPGYKAIAH